MQNVQKLGSKIKSHISKANLSVRDLERLAGLKRSAVSNILEGKIKKPSLDTLRAIAKALNCSLTEFLELEELETSVRLHFPLSPPQEQINFPVHLPLLYETMDILSHCFKNNNYDPNLDLFLQCVKRVYIYALGNGENKIDPKFAEWVVDSVTNSDV
ncbi:MAG: hypothetical protein BGO67_12390 [Alphaproteobacteria bacterium 41-28]|nr:MAG: hypothetical protein BGO67_12390 [Alphaproteobacteria bacterium 41-28]